ncbi:MAG TPA: glycosyltransferase family 2 protein [Candidatus Saccharimonadales bacterium]|nr:glycosyltransferase family 2 protein [Candidatus Saccharimonadales bacterium]
MTDLELPLDKRTPWYRFWEIAPAAMTVIILALPIVLSLINPLWGALFVIVYIMSWLVQAVGMAYRTIQGYNRLGRIQRIDWKKRLDDLEDIDASIDRLKGEMPLNNSALHHYKKLCYLATQQDVMKPSETYNLVIIPTYNESRLILEPSIQALVDSDYDVKRNLIFILAYEERGGPEIEKTSKALIKKYGSKFYAAFAVKHPNNLPDEIKGKGSNANYAGRFFEDWIKKQRKVKPEQVMVTVLDSDNRAHKKYLAALTYYFITTPDPHRKSFQPVAVYTNNIWDVPAPMRVIATGNSFYNLILGQRPHVLRNFSAHSQSFAGLLKTNFWSGRSIVEDGHQYWRSYFSFKGDYSVVGITLPIYQDAMISDTLRKTLKAQFFQLRRWAYGASDIPYVATHCFDKKNKVPFTDCLGKLARLTYNHVSWSTVAIITLFGAWAPLYFGNNADRSIVAHELPVMASWAQRFAMIGLIISIYFAWKLLPPRPERYKRHRSFWMILQWVYTPVIGVFYNSTAAINAQFHLALGKYLNVFNVTDKAIVNTSKQNKLEL